MLVAIAHLFEQPSELTAFIGGRRHLRGVLGESDGRRVGLAAGFAYLKVVRWLAVIERTKGQDLAAEGKAAIGLRMTFTLIGRRIMQGNTIRKAMAVACVGVLLAACNDEATSPPPPTTQQPSSSVVANQVLPQAFLVRAPLDPFFINQMPEMMFRSNIATDLIIQRLVTAPTPGSWHTHSGPTFSIVDEGTVVITRYTKKHGCVSSTYHKGDTYSEEAGEVHRAAVLGSATAVEYKARFYTPVGGPLSSPAADPGCS